MGDQQKILVIAPPWVGDLVMTQALLKLLKRNYPEASIDIFALAVLHPLLKRMPEVNGCLISPFKSGELKLIERFKTASQIKKNRYTQVYLIPNSFKAALIPFLARIPLRIGWRGEQRYFLLNDLRVLDKKKLPLMVERFVALGCHKGQALPSPLPIPQLKISNEQLELTLARLKISKPKTPLLIIAPGSGQGSAKQWPAEYFAAVALTKKKSAWEIWILGGVAEQQAAVTIQRFSNNSCTDLTGKTDLGEVVDLLSLATIVVTNDSGLMHIAAAINKPIVAIYGPTPPELAPPLTANKCKLLSLNLACSPCFKQNCPLQHHRCLRELKPDLVLQAIEDIVSPVQST